MDISSIKRSYMMEKYDFDMQKKKLLDKLGVKSSLFAIRNEKNNVVATYLPYDLEFVYIPEGIYNKGLSANERQQAGEINEDIIFEETEMNVEKGIFVSDILVTRTPVLNSFVQKYMDFQFYEGEAKFAAYLKKENVDSLCMQLNLRLPTEIEWEYFVRAGSEDLFSFGKQLPNDAELEKWLSFDFTDLSCLNCNNFGLYGIYAGDWCSDYYETSDCESQAKEYVIRGGGAYFWPWQADEWIWCMSAMRMSSKGLVDGECGMRLVYDLNNEERWCMNFTNDEIKTYLIKKLKRNADVKYIVNDKYVSADCQEDFEYITFDGIKQEFYVSFLKSQTSIFVNNNEIMFIDDNEKKYYTSSDVDDCIVYEGILNNKSHEQILGLISKFIHLFQGASKVEVVEVKIAEESFDSYTKKTYIINIDNSYVNGGRYKFDNIVMNII